MKETFQYCLPVANHNSLTLLLARGFQQSKELSTADLQMLSFTTALDLRDALSEVRADKPELHLPCCCSGPGCSKLTMSFVKVLLKFQM